VVVMSVRLCLWVCGRREGAGHQTQYCNRERGRGHCFLVQSPVIVKNPGPDHKTDWLNAPHIDAPRTVTLL
jgi:hypothetical protein